MPGVGLARGTARHLSRRRPLERGRTREQLSRALRRRPAPRTRADGTRPEPAGGRAGMAGQRNSGQEAGRWIVRARDRRGRSCPPTLGLDRRTGDRPAVRGRLSPGAPTARTQTACQRSEPPHLPLGPTPVRLVKRRAPRTEPGDPPAGGMITHRAWQQRRHSKYSLPPGPIVRTPTERQNATASLPGSGSRGGSRQAPALHNRKQLVLLIRTAAGAPAYPDASGSIGSAGPPYRCLPRERHSSACRSSGEVDRARASPAWSGPRQPSAVRTISEHCPHHPGIPPGGRHHRRPCICDVSRLEAYPPRPLKTDS